MSEDIRNISIIGFVQTRLERAPKKLVKERKK